MGTFKTVEEAQDKICPSYKINEPQQEEQKKIYDKLHAVFSQLYFAFGQSGNESGSVLSTLIELANCTNYFLGIRMVGWKTVRDLMRVAFPLVQCESAFRRFTNPKVGSESWQKAPTSRVTCGMTSHSRALSCSGNLRRPRANNGSRVSAITRSKLFSGAYLKSAFRAIPRHFAAFVGCQPSRCLHTFDLVDAVHT